MAALSSGLRCASGSGGRWPCPRVPISPCLAPTPFSSSEGEWPLSLSTRAVDVVMLNLRPWETEWRRMELEGLEQTTEERHNDYVPLLICTIRGSGGRPIAVPKHAGLRAVCPLGSPRLLRYARQAKHGRQNYGQDLPGSWHLGSLGSRIFSKISELRLSTALRLFMAAGLATMDVCSR